MLEARCIGWCKKGRKVGQSFYGSKTVLKHRSKHGWTFDTRNLPLSYPRGSNDCSLYGWTVLERVCDKRPCKRFLPFDASTLKETCRSLARSSYAQYNYFLLEKVFFDASLSKHGIVASRGTTRKRARVNNSRDSKGRGIFALIRKMLEKKESWDRLTSNESFSRLRGELRRGINRLNFKAFSSLDASRRYEF